ncbi:tetratricopeptide repeat protein [Kribbella sp. CA-293567]|uniref:tetratricopeptide repeat protein n=1 Tax=Kribbella sp. CA-293567 TaxID=3002436 RepID=UPI0022DD7E26|nr:tetratricopeptide repeat protein [Kribbella sp. CA-293567]WBQ05255.1 hypothetical protein OX958_00300 [Kribbella sp. CA-293567]
MKKQLWDGLGRFSYDNRWLIPGLAIASSVAQFILSKLIVAISFVAVLSFVLFLSALWSVAKQSNAVRPEIVDGDSADEKPVEMEAPSLPIGIDDSKVGEGIEISSLPEATDDSSPADDAEARYMEISTELADKGDVKSLQALYETEMAKTASDEERNKKRAWFEYAYVHAGDSGRTSESLESLKKMVEDRLAPQENILTFYAGALAILGETDGAIGALLQYSELFTLNDRVSALLNAADYYGKSGRHDEGIALLTPILSNRDVDDTQRAEAWKYIGDGVKARTPMQAMASYERALKLSPANTAARFSLAYLYSKHGFHILARYHYGVTYNANLAVPTATNNLGACLVALELPGRGFAMYNRAGEEGSALAWANMAHMLIEAGDFERAKQCIEKGAALSDSEDRIISARESLATVIKTESERAEKLNNDAVLLRAAMADALDAPAIDLNRMSGTWKLDDEREIVLTAAGDTLSGKDSKKKNLVTLTLKDGELAAGVRPSEFEPMVHGFAYCKDDQIVLLLSEVSRDTERIVRLSRSGSHAHLALGAAVSAEGSSG